MVLSGMSRAHGLLHRLLLGAVIIIGAAVLFKALVGQSTVALFDPAGPIGGSQSRLIALMVGLMLLLAVPAYIGLFSNAWKYRKGASDARYEPERTGSLGKELALWALPGALITVLSVLNWKSAHSLDPYLPIPGERPLTVEVIALPWKWLFIYPAQGIASVNHLEFPEKTPIHLKLTADAPMSSFWIPQLGSQMYAMAAMVTQLNLEAYAPGEYLGKATEINGDGYAGMTFTARSVTASDFDKWVAAVKAGRGALTMNAYTELAAASEWNKPAFYSSVERGIFDGVVMKYMMPPSKAPTGPSSERSMMEMSAGPGMGPMPGMRE